MEAVVKPGFLSISAFLPPSLTPVDQLWRTGRDLCVKNDAVMAIVPFTLTLGFLRFSPCLRGEKRRCHSKSAFPQISVFLSVLIFLCGEKHRRYSNHALPPYPLTSIPPYRSSLCGETAFNQVVLNATVS